MSKLDEIQYEIYGATRPKHPDGSEMAITPKTRQQIKALFLELVPEYTHNDSTAHSELTNEKVKTGFNYAVKKFKQRVDEL